MIITKKERLQQKAQYLDNKQRRQVEWITNTSHQRAWNFYALK